MKLLASDSALNDKDRVNVMKNEQFSPLSEQENTMELEKINTTEFPTVVVAEPEFDSEKTIKKMRNSKKKRGFFRKVTVHAESDEAIVAQESSGMMTAEEDEVKVFGNDEMADTCEVSVSQKTRILDDHDDADAGNEQVTQMVLDGFEGDEVAEEGEDEALYRIRQEKIQDFSQKREEHERAEAKQAEEQLESKADETPETPVEKPVEQPQREEFVSYHQQAALRQKLQTASRKAGSSLIVAAVSELILFFMAVLSFATPAVSMMPATYLIFHLALLTVMIVTCGKRLKIGFSNLFRRFATIESGVALVTVVTVIHTVLQLINPAGISDGSMPLFTAVTGFSLLLLQLSQKLEATRVSRMFDLVAAQGEKLTAKRIEDSALAEEIGRPAVAIGEPRVTYFRKTEFSSDYLMNTEDSDCGHSLMRWYLPLVLILSFVAALVYLLLNGVTSWLFAVTVFCAMLCISTPAVLALYLFSSIAVATNSMRSQKTALIGYDAVREYGSSHAVAIDAIDLFPETSVLLHGIKTFAGTRIDDAILDAASVSVRAGGPLSHVFRRMILNKVDMLHEVDTLVYEQDMGLSGWVSGRRVLIGNRKLLDNHGIDIPSKDYEERYAKNGRQLVYLSIAGELSAMFVVSYIATPHIKKVLTDLTNRRVTLLVRTCDPNITEALVASTFELNGFYVELFGAPAGRSFETLVEGVSKQESAGIVSNGDMTGMMDALARCRRLRSGVCFFTVIQSILGIFGLALTACLAFISGTVLPPLYAVEFLVASAVISTLSAWGFSKA